MTTITAPEFTNEDKARAFLEASRWPDGAACPSCGLTETVSALPPKGSMGKGWYHCRQCREKFTVRVGTLYERSHIPLHKWLLATHLLCASKKGISSHQLARMLGITYKSAWFMAHRIREGMRPTKDAGPKGGEGKIVEADETFIGGKERNKHVGKRDSAKIGGAGKEIAFSLVERGGKVRSFHVPKVTAKTLRPISGVGDYMWVVGTSRKDPTLGLCSSSGGPSHGAMLQAFLNWAEKHPEQWNKEAEIGVGLSLREIWPCAPGKTN